MKTPVRFSASRSSVAPKVTLTDSGERGKPASFSRQRMGAAVAVAEHIGIARARAPEATANVTNVKPIVMR